jgi:hypothetical protein
LDLVGCCPIVAGCEGAPITIQPSRPPKYRSAADAILCLRVIKDEVLLTVSCPIFPSILIAKNLLTGSLKNRSIDNLETQKKYISMKNFQFFDYLLYAKSK